MFRSKHYETKTTSETHHFSFMKKCIYISSSECNIKFYVVNNCLAVSVTFFSKTLCYKTKQNTIETKTQNKKLLP